jgi:hypothetical protein
VDAPGAGLVGRTVRAGRGGGHRVTPPPVAVGCGVDVAALVDRVPVPVAALVVRLGVCVALTRAEAVEPGRGVADADALREA